MNQFKRHQRGSGIVANPGLYPPHFNIDPRKFPAWRPLGSLPPGNSLKPTQWFGPHSPESPVTNKRQGGTPLMWWLHQHFPYRATLRESPDNPHPQCKYGLQYKQCLHLLHCKLGLS